MTRVELIREFRGSMREVFIAEHQGCSFLQLRVHEPRPSNPGTGVSLVSNSNGVVSIGCHTAFIRFYGINPVGIEVCSHRILRVSRRASQPRLS